IQKDETPKKAVAKIIPFEQKDTTRQKFWAKAVTSITISGLSFAAAVWCDIQAVAAENIINEQVMPSGAMIPTSSFSGANYLQAVINVQDYTLATVTLAVAGALAAIYFVKLLRE
ncbi:MAG: hypothetical protein QXR73_02180, partial [Candidatus Micrarchaeaceae archaeon]